ncbi:hypothetical protein [Chryseobacterium sp.]|uniref:hypothetical protein n=2 Tax=unclassified Chryseobacterium TaxID=2593645 RepID=UPI00261A418F|nr:hypothetical protein [Chryseobacterium sp.]
MCTIQSINIADQQKTHARDCMANNYLLTYKFKKMKTLNVSQMENLQGGSIHQCNITAIVAGGVGALIPAIGVGAAIWGLGCYLYSM